MPEQQSETTSQFQAQVAAQLVPVKLTEDNYSLWKSLMVPVLKNYDMFNMVQGLEQPLTEDKDQKCLLFMKLTLSVDMLSYAAEACSSSRALWLKLEVQGEIAKRRIIQLRTSLKNIKRGDSMNSDYYNSAKKLADKLKAAGSPVPDGDFVEHVLNGLPSHYVAFANSIRVGNTRADAISMTPEELHDLLVAEQARRIQQNQQMDLEADRKRALVILGTMFSVGFILFIMCK